MVEMVATSSSYIKILFLLACTMTAHVVYNSVQAYLRVNYNEIVKSTLLRLKESSPAMKAAVLCAPSADSSLRKKRSFDSFTGAGFTGLDKRSFDSFTGAGFTGLDKRAFDSLAGSGLTPFNKRAFDSFGSGGFGGFDKRAFDSLAGSGFSGFDKRAFDSLAGSGFEAFNKRSI